MMTTLGNSKSLKFSKYFPNKLEYASRVYKDNTDFFEKKDKRPRKKRLNSSGSKQEQSSASPIVDPTDLEVTMSKQNEHHEDEAAHPEVNISATKTDAADIIERVIQNYDKSVQDIGTQTEEEIDPDNQKDILMETPEKPKLEAQPFPTVDAKQSTTPPPDQSSIDNPDFSIDPPKIWNDLKSFGEPRIIVSVIGAYNECTPTYELTDYLLLQNALNHVGKYAGRCGFIYQEEKTNIVQSIVSECCHIESLPHTYGFFAVHLFDDAKEVTENKGQHKHDTSCSLEEVKALLEIENYINSKEKVCFEDVQQESDMRSKIRVPVALLVLNGDLDTLEHVLRAIYSDMSVVVVKGTGGAADLIALCLEDFTKLKRELPIMFARRFNLFLFNKIQGVMELIVQKEWMVLIYLKWKNIK